jgi:alpha-amylase
MSKSIVLYLHAHQPWRVKSYQIFDVGFRHDYFEDGSDQDTNNQKVLLKVADKSYRPTNKLLLDLLNRYPQFKVSLSITGTLIEQLEAYAPDVLDSFRRLVDTGRVEILGETYYHSLAFFYSKPEFIKQVALHEEKIRTVFGVTPTAFRNTELAYNNQLGVWADDAGYKAVIAEGWDNVLGWRNANHVYRPPNTSNIKLLLKNYRLSDDLAFRFGDKQWPEWPLDAKKYNNWLMADPYADVINLFMDYETFGEHQWADTGIFDFLKNFPSEWLSCSQDNDFATITEAATHNTVSDEVDFPSTITWADTERDLSAWLGNSMQNEAINAIYGLEGSVLGQADPLVIQDWRRLQTSDHFYYMCTKWFNDGDIHSYFSPYSSPYDAFIYFMNTWRDMSLRSSNGDF